MAQQDEFRKLPKLDALLLTPRVQQWVQRSGREPVVVAIRQQIEDGRKTIQAGKPCPSVEQILQDAAALLEEQDTPSLRPVINASGVVIHTNLGRSPLSEEAITAMSAAARGYCSLEFDLEGGGRGSRNTHCAALLAKLTGADDGIAVNNNASSVLLLLAAFGRDREIIVSRSQLIEIGGGFRVPDVMRNSGCKLVEVGTTNRTYVADYEEAITDRTAAIMLLHRSNFMLSGFVHDPEIAELAELCNRRKILLIDDVGSGTFLDTDPYGLPHEPKVQERVAAGAHIVCFSGDKLLGGPQAGLIVGRKELIATAKKHPLMRAMRVDKVGLAGIETTLRHYVRGDALTKIPIWRSISATAEKLGARAETWVKALALPDGMARVVNSVSTVGGGSLPGLTVPTRALALKVPNATSFSATLRSLEPPVVGRIEEDLFLADPRTVMPYEDELLLGQLRKALDAEPASKMAASGSARTG